MARAYGCGDVRGPCVELRLRERGTHDGRMARTLNLIYEHPREALVVRFERRWSSRRSSARWPMRWSRR